ncbi:hypothetical protein SAMN04487950_3909 [Halogranum rubrum]|uniref:Yip1 domain-containing protein n=1 Tax=Halogranum rubrum TaxID=553466 RepID=A0A1I4HYP6_9EURY|nr:Yip1 family protein [Halogranum rubrum]SFL46883.1 hypothetical protein SAMN04487950_3909 [Halogranum rubrum]
MNVLTSPNEFFRRESEDPRLLQPALIVTAVALLGVALQYVLFSTISASISNPDTAGFMNLIMYVSMAFSFLAAFLGWLIYAGIFYLLSMIFDGEGSFGTVFKLVGWGYVPGIFSAAVTGVAYLVFLGGDSVNSPTGFAAAMQNPLNGPILWAISLFGIVFTLWQGALFAFAMRHGRDLTMKQAALVVSPLILLSVGGSIFTIVSGLV